MANLCYDAPEQQIVATGATAALTLIASFGDPVVADLGLGPALDLSKGDALPRLRTLLDGIERAALILFLPQRLDRAKMLVLDEVLLAADAYLDFVGVVSSFGVHFGDRADTEAYVSGCLSRRVPLAIFRPSFILSEHSPATRLLRRFSFLAPLLPRRVRGCCVDVTELGNAVVAAREQTSRRRVYTLLGPNRPWRDRLREQRRGLLAGCLYVLCAALSFLLIGQLAAVLFDLLAYWRPTLRRWHFDTLTPRSFAELLALYHPFNFRHVKVVGYNNGVRHFGQSHPGKTVLSMVHCKRVARVGADEIQADAGATIRKAMDFVAEAEQELLVVPNYSYVCLGTAFFVPIHGSASACATVAESITEALLYDPHADRFVRASCDEPAFRERVYHMGADVLLLRLRLRVKPRTSYVVRREELTEPTADVLLAVLRDTAAANVEIRKANAAGLTVELSKYYHAIDGAMAVPRDALGRLWDRLEEHAVTSFLMHALTRWFAWHVELFFSADEFSVFWETHRTLPLKKIQLRYIRRDGLPQSPFREHDCVSVDLFMFRWQRAAFEAYLKRTFAVVRANPGKHSQ